MDITPLTPKGKLVLNRYGNGGFVINETAYRGSILITGQSVLSWPIHDIAEVTHQSFAPLLAGDHPEIVLLGTGVKFAPMLPALRSFFHDRAIACDAMDTGAACRTYSVLLAEGRAVAAALIAV